MKKKIALLILLLYYIGYNSPAFSKEKEFEVRLCVLLNKTYGYYNIEKILFLIMWESDIIKNIPCISPIDVTDYRNIAISSDYGLRHHPILNEYKHHSGIDLPANEKDTVYSPANGCVKKVSYDDITGNYIKLGHQFNYETLYGHLHSVFINEGDSVKIGQPIGLIGNTGRSTAAHLHYEINKKGKKENPYPYCFLLLKYSIHQKKYHSSLSFGITSL